MRGRSPLCSPRSWESRRSPGARASWGFGTYHYRYESGREGTSALAGFSPRKAHLVVYPIGGFGDKHHRLLERLGPHKTGKGCLYLKRLADVDLDVLRKLVKRSMSVRRSMDRASTAG